MADFKAALKEGFAAAKKAELARKEIADVLEKLKMELFEASDGRLLVQLGEFQEPIRLTPMQQILRSPGLLSGLGVPDFRTYRALAATNPKIPNKPPVRELAKWKQERDGYPCTLTWNSEERQCQDRVALEECLPELLKDPAVG